MAYAALASLARAIDQILPQDQDYAFLCGKEQMVSLHEQVVVLQELLDNTSTQSFSLTSDDLPESQIRDVAYKLEDIIESIICRSLGQEFESDTQLLTSNVFCGCIEEVGVLLKKATKMKKGIPSALASLARAIDQILPKDDVYAFLCGKEKMKSLHEKVFLLQKSLENISGKSHSSTISVPKNRIADVVSQLDDIMESIMCKSPGQEFAGEIDKQEFCRCFEEVDVLLVESMDMEKNLENKDTSKGLNPLPKANSSVEASSATEVNVGIDDDLTRILDKITGDGKDLQIVPITGMGGIGKTTLARAAYESSVTVNYFDVRVWVTVSGEFRIEDIFRGILPAKQQKEVPDKELFDSVHKRLIRQRYLIVLDDMWHTKVWDDVMRAFPNDKNGSRVVLTTRLLEVAKYVANSVDMKDIHEMRLLNEKDSWDLFSEKVYGRDNITEFEDIGKTISNNCKGLPLAIVVIAGMLKFKRKEEYWNEIARNTKEEAASGSEHFFKIIALSYTNLPFHLKACFLYMGAFKEDYKIPTKEISMIWMAEGFLRKPKDSKQMEKVAEECLEELVERSLVLVTERGYNGKINTSSVHDVLREVSLRKSKEENFLHHFTDGDMNEISFQNNIKVQRRISFSEFPPESCDTSARSIVNKYPMSPQGLAIIHHYQLLRVLYKVLVENASNLSTLFGLTNLRYLHFVRDETYPPLNFPESVSNLQNLESLVFSGILPAGKDRYEVVLPVEIWKLPRLRHIVMMHKSYLSFNNDYPALESLQTLSWVTNFDFSKGAVEKIPNIKQLGVAYRSIAKNNTQQFHLDNLIHLQKLEELAIFCDYAGPQRTKFAFPKTLKKLSLERTRIPWGNMSIVGSLPCLEKLKLKWFSVTGREWAPIEGEFLSLKYLKMDELVIVDWIANSKHFPQLETLIIKSCESLNAVPSEIGEIDTLKKMIVKYCTCIDSVKEIEEEQLAYGDTDLEFDVSNDDFLLSTFR